MSKIVILINEYVVNKLKTDTPDIRYTTPTKAFSTMKAVAKEYTKGMPKEQLEACRIYVDGITIPRHIMGQTLFGEFSNV